MTTVLAASLLGARPASAGNDFLKPLWGLHAGATFTYGALASNPGRFAFPVLGAHFLFSVSRSFNLRTYLEYQAFDFKNANTLFSGALGNRAVSAIFMPAYMITHGALGDAYVAAGAGWGFNSTFDQSVPWAAAAWGTHFKRSAYLEVRAQFNLARNTFQDMYFLFTLGFHFNPREPTWNESLAEEGVR
ncbi:MAG TPA: hypothetical protein VL588_10610 [Bdellovibrionota bacterium]|nr:hypothetical protein [Bdellovibrionota bacterium]